MVIVSLQDRNISRVDVVALQLRPDTHTLDLSRNRIVKINALDALTNLQVLNLSFNRLVKLEGLSRLRMLHVVNVSNNSLRDFGCLAQCLSLQELYVLAICHTSVAFSLPFHVRRSQLT
jgi:Leucine-rich repeat (LRR) protein